MKIAYVASRYCWDSYSTLRTCFENLLLRPNYDVEWFENISYAFNSKCNMIWLMGSDLIPTKEQFEKSEARVISFCLSDPRFHRLEKVNNCHVYCTNDYTTYNGLRDKKITYYYITSCDSNYHRYMNLPKETDLLFIGLGKHPCIKDRIHTVNRLREDGFKVKVFGDKWNEHKDNYPYIKGLGMITEINKAKLCLDLTNGTSSLGHRIFESSCCGTPVITKKREDVVRLFADNKEILLYDDYEHMRVKIEYYLKNEAVLKDIGMNARVKCLERYNITPVVDNLLQFLQGVV